MKVELSPLKEVVLSEAGDQANGPCEWEEVRLGEVIEFKRGYDLPQRNRILGNTPVVSSSGITDWHSEAKVKGPGVITGRYGTLGEIYFIRDDFWPLNTALYVRDFKGNDPRFISYFLRGIDFLAYSDKAAVPGLNRNHLHEAIVHYPTDIGEQRAIAHILGTLDDKIELNRRMNQTLEEMARAIYQDWFVDFGPVRAKLEGQEPYLPPDLWDLFPDRLVDSELGGVPAKWGVKTLGEVCEKPQYGYTASAQSEPVGPKFLRITDINKKPWIEWTNVPHCAASDQDCEKFQIRKGDVLIARMADPGHGVMVEENLDAVFASYLIRFRPRNVGHGRLLQYWLKSDDYWELVRSRGSGTTRISLNASVLSQFLLLIPNDPMAKHFTNTVDSIRNRIVSNVREMDTLAAQRDALMAKLFSGEVRVGI